MLRCAHSEPAEGSLCLGICTLCLTHNDETVPWRLYDHVSQINIKARCAPLSSNKWKENKLKRINWKKMHLTFCQYHNVFNNAVNLQT